MKKFVMIYKISESAHERMKSIRAEEKKKNMGKWFEWQKNIGDALVEMGTPLGGGQKVSQSGSSDAGREIVGYSILQAENIEEAKKIVKKNPHVGMGPGCEIEVYETMPMPK